MSATLVELKGIGKNYPLVSQRGDRIRALWDLVRGRPVSHSVNILHDIDLTVRRGESIGLIGENGAGKSTLLKIITGVLQASSGTVSTRGRIGALLELGAGFHAEHTGYENLFLAGALMGMKRREVLAHYDAIVDFAEIGDYIHEPIKHYSSGMVVRLGFALVAVTRPDLLITDEVLAVGDESFQRKCVQWIEDYLSGGGTLMIVSHAMYPIQTLCQQAAWLQDGTIHRFGDAYEVTQAYLAHHERKLQQYEEQREANKQFDAAAYRVTELTINQQQQAKLWMGEDFVAEGQVYAPDGRCPRLMFGLLRIDGRPIFSASSDDDGYHPVRIDENRYAFRLRLPDLPLLPGHYVLRVHAMDPEGLRLFDPKPCEFTVGGKTSAFGVVRIPYRWEQP
jgi:lipopolysaccharide transport system ATP-binding protein